MDLNSILVSEFAKITNDNKETVNEGTTVYGTYRVDGDGAYVQIDGSDTRTPVATTSEARNGDRVTVLIKNHRAIITGNLTDPSTTVKSVEERIETGVGTIQETIDNLKTQLDNQEITLDDYRKAIAEAKRMATDYIDFTAGTGLVIGSSSISSNVRIYSGGIDIRDGDKILASYTDDVISLGKNNSSSVIKMCNESFEMSTGYYDSNTTESKLIAGTDMLTIGKLNNRGGLDQFITFGASTFGDIEVGGTMYAGSMIVNSITTEDGESYLTSSDLSGYYTSGDNIYANKLYIQGAGNISGDPNARLAATSPYQLGYASGSSRKFKHDIKPIENAELDPKHLYDIEVVQFKYNDDYLEENDQRYGIDCIGFIAEQVNDVYPIAADRETGEPRNWEMRYLIPPMLALIQQHKNKLDELESRLEALEKKEV